MADKPAENGFEYDGTFYRWSITTIGKDLILIDRFTRLPFPEFAALIDDAFEVGRTTVQLAMIATSIRAGRPDWTVERIIRIVENLDWATDLEFITADREEDPFPPGSDATTPTGNGSPSPSRSPSSDPTRETYATSNATPD